MKSLKRSSVEAASARTDTSMLVVTNRQRTKKISRRQLKQIASALFAELKITEAELGINLVGTREMTLINEAFLRHTGSTDVITFDHSFHEPNSGTGVPPVRSETHGRDARATGRASDAGSRLHGELFICVDKAVTQAKIFKTSWQSEIIRYLVHGVLHLTGHDDLKPALRRAMKREENRLVRLLARRFSLAQLSRAIKIGV